MLDFIRKIFRKNNKEDLVMENNISESQKQNTENEAIKAKVEQQLKNVNTQNIAVAAAMLKDIPSAPKKKDEPVIIREFDVTLYEEDEDATGKLIKKIVNGGKPERIEATSPQDLNEKLSLYRQCGQFPQVKPVGVPMILNPDGTRSPYTPQNKEQKQEKLATSENVADNRVNVDENMPAKVQRDTAQMQEKRPIRYYKIGGIEVKDDNGKIYQKQWMKLSDSEARNIRVVNDKNNAIVNISGKHLEMMKWILVEDSNDDDATQMEESLND